MKRTTTATGLLALAAMLVLGVFAGSASAGGGPNSFFLWTGPLPGLVLVLSDNEQIFTSEPGGPPIECEHFGGHAFASNGKAMTTKEVTLTGVYTKCFAANLFPATVSPVAFLLNADGSITILNPIVITVPELGCSLKLANNTANTNLRLLLFLNRKEDLLVHSDVRNLTSLSSGDPCGAAGVEHPEGTYAGLLLAFVHGGILQWRK
ncbi:MAG TPA: hypothetical protein VFY36_03105 [Solirubrobacteraceae bacterium]|nr:hypothetical protein [Solirubrobacteraceae bacterium]